MEISFLSRLTFILSQAVAVFREEKSLGSDIRPLIIPLPF